MVTLDTDKHHVTVSNAGIMNIPVYVTKDSLLGDTKSYHTLLHNPSFEDLRVNLL